MQTRQKLLSLAVLGVLSASFSAAHAQTTPAPAPTPAPSAKIERVEVTGSNIKRVDTETAAPITIITRDEIARSGQTTITQLLRELPINAAGGLTELTGSGSFSAGAASASLRGLGSSATLVLLNGRRIAPYGLADPNFGQSGVVNLNAIPLDVIDRIEILKDGASAIYGSEAIAGVINIILRRDFTGAQLGLTAAANKDGKYGSETVTAGFGYGDLARDRFNIFGNVEMYKQDQVLFKEVESFINRQQFKDVYLTGVPNSAYSPFLTYITNAAGATGPAAGPGCPASSTIPAVPFLLTSGPGTMCLYDQWEYVLVQPKAKRDSFFARANWDVTPNTSLYAEGSYVESETYFLGPPRAVGQGTGATFNPTTGRLTPAPQQFAIGHPNNPFNRLTSVRGRTDAVGRQDNEVKSKTTRIVLGGKTTFGIFDAEAGYMFNKGEIESYNYNELRLDRLAQAFGFTYGTNAQGNPILLANPAGGYFNFSNPNGGQVTADSLRINAKDDAVSQFEVFDVKMSGELFRIAGGGVSMAAGAEFRKEERKVTPDAAKVAGNIFGRGVGTADGERDVRTLFGEVVVPLMKNLEIQAALRYDKYSDYGNSTTPKLAFSYSPIADLKIRGSYAEGFRAPSLTEITRSATSGFFNGIDDPRRCNRASGITVGCGLSIPGLIVANPLVQPEEAESYTLGLVWDINKDSSFSFDYFRILREKEISFLSLNEILLNEGSTDPRYAGRITRDPGNTNAAIPNDPGAILFVSTGFDNLGKTHVEGVDMDLRHRLNLGERGKLNLNAVATFYIEQKGSGAPGARLISYNGYRNAPKWRGQLRGSWEIKSWTHTAQLNWLGSMRSHSSLESLSGTGLAAARDCANPVGTYLGVCRIRDHFTLDLSTEWRGIKNLRVNLAARNVTNQKPQLDPLARPFNFVWYQPQGLYLVGSVRYDFK
jgi:iron complex outermembrane recepter protein